jgi:hypothetical protein
MEPQEAKLNNAPIHNGGNGALTFLVVINILIGLMVLYDTLVIHHIVQDLAQLGVQIT